jgi:glycosyltransferase involved in cell wall biosynthesis
MRATLVIPTLDEAASIATVLRSFRAAAEEGNRTLFRDAPLDWEVLVVDGASKDGTAEIATAEGARVIVERRRGYGRAYRTGFAAATGEVIATADGDATYPVESVPALVRKLLDEPIDFLSGDRMAHIDRRSMTTEHRIGNWVLNLTLRLLYHRYLRALPGRTLADSQSGFWVFRRRVLEEVRLTQDGMPLSEELKIEAIRCGLRFVEVPIRYGERAGPPKLQSWRDGLRNLKFLFEKRLEIARARRATAPPAA